MTGGGESGVAGFESDGEENREGEFVYIPGGTGDWYQPDEKTFTTLLQDFKTQAEAAPINQTATGFFDVTITGGSCPIWTIPSTWVFPAIAIDAQCSSAMENMWPVISAIIIATAAFLGFRVAFG